MDDRTLRHVVARDEGASTAMMLTVFAALMILLAAALTLIQVQVAASRAAVAADLAALSASDAARGLMLGQPCALAADTVQAHGASLVACDIADQGVAYVSVQLATPLGLQATAESRAGPKRPWSEPPPQTAGP